ncbi:MAG: ABC transporter ATP-binding protein [Blautia sp.]|nr:ABC transporter ATP-binding protein [Blautia sp.]MBR2561866.1 ABC transporter ATP-binding protein [Eubacterium sp.]
MKHISKRFGKVVANDKVDLDIYRGEILALLGENGSGKTTLMNMLSGIYYPDEGEIAIDGKPVTISSPKEAFDLGIGMIHQHFKLVDVLTATENIVLGLDGQLDLKGARTKISQICDAYGFEVDLNQKIYDMSVSQKQTVEIIKVLYRGADILILDEPTAVLTPQETDKLFAVLKSMRDDGKAIVIITHKMHEVKELSDRVAVLRHGEYVGDVLTKDTDAQEMTNMMVGHAVSLNIKRPEPVNPMPRLEVKHLTVRNEEGMVKVDDVSFTAYSGEILGIAGIAGSGQKELLEAIIGLQPLESGEIIFTNPKKDKPVTFFHKSMKRVKELGAEGAFHDENMRPVSFDGMSTKEIKKWVDSGNVLFWEDEIVDLRHKNPQEIRELGIRLSFVPEDRLGMGLVGSMGITDNMMLRSYRKGHLGFVDRKAPKEQAEQIIRELEIVTPGVNTPVRRLSGGNVQKVLVGREIAFTPKVLMAAYPVRGLDINSSYTIYDLLNRQKANGVAVIYVGEDLDVLLELADRILVLCGGKVSGIIPGRGADKRKVGMMMTHVGGEKNNG